MKILKLNYNGQYPELKAVPCTVNVQSSLENSAQSLMADDWVLSKGLMDH